MVESLTGWGERPTTSIHLAIVPNVDPVQLHARHSDNRHMRSKARYPSAIVRTLLLAGGLFAVLSVGFITAQHDEAPVTSKPGAPPAVSAAVGEPAVEGRLAAHVEVEGQRFDVYVGDHPSPLSDEARVWSLALPARD